MKEDIDPKDSNDFRKALYAYKDYEEQPLDEYPSYILFNIYYGILTDNEGGGAYEPIAEGIRQIWADRGGDMSLIWALDKRFKNIKRKIIKKKIKKFLTLSYSMV